MSHFFEAGPWTHQCCWVRRVTWTCSRSSSCLVARIGLLSSDLSAFFLLLGQRPGVFIRLIYCWVSSEFFGSECPLLRSIRLCFWSGSLFNAECSEMRLVRWWACSGSNHLTRVSGWWCQIVVWLLSTFVEILQIFRFLRWISLLDSVLFLAIFHWHWYHSLCVTIVRFLGSLMAQGSVLGGCVSCWDPSGFCCWGGSRYWSSTFLFVTMS